MKTVLSILFILSLAKVNGKTVSIDLIELLAEANTIANVSCQHINYSSTGSNDNDAISIEFRVNSCIKGELLETKLLFNETRISKSIRANCFGLSKLVHLFKENESYVILLDSTGRLIYKTKEEIGIEKLIKIFQINDDDEMRNLCLDILKNGTVRIRELLSEVASHKKYGKLLKMSLREEILIDVVSSNTKIRSVINESTNVLSYMWSASNPKYDKVLLDKMKSRFSINRKDIIYWSELSKNSALRGVLTEIENSKDETDKIKNYAHKRLMNFKNK